MASADQIKALLKSHLEGDDERFFSIAMQVAAHEAKLGHGQLAMELREMIDAAKMRLAADRSGKPVPLAKPRGELANLLTVTYPKIRLVDMVLDEKTAAQLQQVIKEQRLFARIREHGLAPRRKLLLVGPTGSGKTMTASVLASELGVPLFLVRLDSLITKFMGETAAKLRQVFDSVSDVRGVYFFDEFDAIGSQRSLANDVGEIRRVLNSFLLMIEHDQSNSLIVAATNHPEILDYALFRRFDDVIEYKRPTADQIVGLIRSRLGGLDLAAWLTYPSSLSTNLIHDPGQAWNALTVGAFTSKVDTEDATLTAVAPDGGPSPFTTTSAPWDKGWPLKPDVVMEGGNAGKDALSAVEVPSLNLLTAHYRPVERLFTTINATSAASALCARMAAQLLATYPDLRPETIRGLIVHSAEWTDAMRQMYLPGTGTPTKAGYANLIRHCGWGVPDIDRALWSAANSLTLIVEDSVHPYKKVTGKGIKTRDMNLHALPWPREQLEALQNTQVQMRVTLSYFVEPNPSARGTTSKFYYPSHRLRFDVQRPLDASTADFIARINAAANREDDGDPINPQDPDWWLGERFRHRGSLHQDTWEGSAADLASRGFIAVYPSMGWWRTRPALERYDLPARYSLIVSIRTEQIDVDLFTAIANQIATAVAVEH